MANILGIGSIALLCAFLAWQLWTGLARGRMPLLSYTPLDRAKGPFVFWFTFVFWALVLVFMTFCLATYLWSLATGHAPA
jgi:hypothetical protein